MSTYQIKHERNSRGYSFGVFKDPHGQVWADFFHKTNEIVVLAEGEIGVEIEGKAQRPQNVAELFIPANADHKVRNVGRMNNVWYSDIEYNCLEKGYF